MSIDFLILNRSTEEVVTYDHNAWDVAMNFTAAQPELETLKVPEWQELIHRSYRENIFYEIVSNS